jgi:type III restriction enzyme
VANLYEELEIAARISGRPALPDLMLDGIRPAYELRPYQAIALANFIAYFETERDLEPVFRQFPSQTLFHMATGSGKTLIMAALILYLYGRGYRDFLFFVNSTNVLEKTRDNFLNPASPKYLFNEAVRLNGDPVLIREVANFQFSGADSINLCFSTIQGLHTDLTSPRENQMTYEDFEQRRVALISDEAHHINALTKRRKELTKSEKDEQQSWEGTVARILAAHPENVMLEFTATTDLANPAIKAKYEDKIVADYPLSRYRSDGYSKEIQLLQADLPPVERALQAVVLSQYRLKLFERRGLAIKPVAMFKSRSIKGNGDFLTLFAEMIAGLDEARLERLHQTTTAVVVQRAFAFFAAQGITLDLLAAELREDFAPLHCLAIDSVKITPAKQLAVNTLESPANPYRAVFAVDMLNEGWDVLNLFDIVRLYDTRDAKKGKPGRTTTQEAQLIGRGARYCPFRLGAEDDMYKRKFDANVANELRSCEELYFHSAANVRYIDELRTALRETGALPQQAVEVQYKLKDQFAASDLYQHGWVFANQRLTRNRAEITELPASIRSRQFNVRSGGTGATRSGEAFGTDVGATVPLNRLTRQLAELPAPVMATALRRNEGLRFDRLRALLPNLRSLSEFWRSASYIGAIQLTLEAREAEPTPEQWLRAADAVLHQVANDLKRLALERRGSREFEPRPFQSVITDRTVYVADPSGDGVGIPQSRVREDLRLDLSASDWFGYTENYGTTEEKRFLVYFNGVAERLRQHYDLVVMLRNEGQLSIYDFDTGQPFQPDFLLILRQASGGEYSQYQVLVEPKGAHLVEKDRWKEDLLLSLEQQGVAAKSLADDNQYLVWGLPFYTHESPQDLRRFTDALDRLVSPAVPTTRSGPGRPRRQARSTGSGCSAVSKVAPSKRSVRTTARPRAR